METWCGEPCSKPCLYLWLCKQPVWVVARNRNCIISYKPLYCSVAFQFYSSVVIVLYFEYQKTSKSVLRVEGHVVANGIYVFLLHSIVKFSEYALFSQKHLWGAKMAGKGIDLYPTGQRIVAPALAKTQKFRHHLQLQVTSLGRTTMAR